jgi:hypothetical protein
MKMINKLKKGQVTIFGKTISVLTALITLVALSGVGMALLSAYITLTGSATVGQSVVLDTGDPTGGCHLTYAGQTQDTCISETCDNTGCSAAFTINVVGGETRDVGLKVKNQASVPATFDLLSSSQDPLYATDVVTTYYSNYNSVGEVCLGDPIDPESIQLGALGNQWYCVRYVWNIASSPATYSITITVAP